MRFHVVWDHPEPCPYLPGQVARMPMRLPVDAIAPDAFDRLLAEGDRRNGVTLYRTRCPRCTACEPIRIPVQEYVPTPNNRRILRRNADLRVEIGAPQVTPRHLELLNRHKIERGLSRTGEDLDIEQYRLWLVLSCVDTREVRYFDGDRLIAVSILDFGNRACSSVYHYFDPDESRRSLGVYSVLRELELVRGMGLGWYYLGLYVAECRHLAYKADYYPHQRRIDGTWQTFSERPGA